DLTIQDLSVTNRNGAYHAGLNFFDVTDVKVRRVETIGVKGNGGITIAGNNSSTKNICVENCYVHGTYDGDGINIGGCSNVYILNNYVKNAGRHLIEGGGIGNNIFIKNNYLNTSVFNGIAAFAGNGIIIADNIITNIGSNGIYLSE